MYIAMECAKVVQGHLRSLISGANQTRVCDFLSVINSNLDPILHRFRNTETYWSKIANFPTQLPFNSVARSEPFRCLDETYNAKTRITWLSVFKNS